jgi:DNA-binding transcriptional ArsR family regulator
VWDGERSAGEIHSAMSEVSFGAVSQHLRRLSAAGLVAQRAEGRYRYYQARKDDLGPLREWLETMWDDALARLKTPVELEAARRGPRPQKEGARRVHRKRRVR